jgi:type IX secretion system PorP/SprF family membrane protein
MKTLTLVFLTLVTTTILAQQDPLYSQYMQNPLLVNPSYAGLNNRLNGMVGYRTQWTGLQGQPQTMNASVHTSLVHNKIGIGILFLNDQIGNISNTETNVALSYKLDLGKQTFSFGMQAGMQNYRTDHTRLKFFDPDDNAFTGGERGSRLNIGAGAVLKSEKFFIGLSVPRLLPSTFKNGGQEFELYNQHYYLMGAYVYYLSERLRIKPSVLLRGVKGAPVSADIAMNININGIHTAGVFTRNLNTYGILVQTMLKEQYRFGYAFELPTNRSVGTNFATHEISLGVLLSVFSYHEHSLGNF